MLKTPFLKNLSNTLFFKSSPPISELFNNSLDFVYIDASHDYDSVKEDIKHWLPKIRENGILAGDDMEWHLGDGVKRAVNELLPKHIQDRNTWLYRK